MLRDSPGRLSRGGGCPGHRTPRPGGSPSPPPVCAGAERARGGGPGAEGRDRAKRISCMCAGHGLVRPRYHAADPRGRHRPVGGASGAAPTSRRIRPALEPLLDELTRRARLGFRRSLGRVVVRPMYCARRRSPVQRRLLRHAPPLAARHVDHHQDAVHHAQARHVLWEIAAAVHGATGEP